MELIGTVATMKLEGGGTRVGVNVDVLANGQPHTLSFGLVEDGEGISLGDPFTIELTQPLADVEPES